MPHRHRPATTCRSGLSGRIVRDVSLRIAPGEILGVTGLIGSGYDELPHLLSGAQAAEAGTLTLSDGSRHDLSRLGPAAAIAAGIAFIPAIGSGSVSHST